MQIFRVPTPFFHSIFSMLKQTYFCYENNHLLLSIMIPFFLSIRCDISPAVEESDFWRFQAITLTIGLMSYTVVYLRQQKLDQKLLEKINKQISA